MKSSLVAVSDNIFIAHVTAPLQSVGIPCSVVNHKHSLDEPIRVADLSLSPKVNLEPSTPLNFVLENVKSLPTILQVLF